MDAVSLEEGMLRVEIQGVVCDCGRGVLVDAVHGVRVGEVAGVFGGGDRDADPMAGVPDVRGAPEVDGDPVDLPGGHELPVVGAIPVSHAEYAVCW